MKRSKAKIEVIRGGAEEIQLNSPRTDAPRQRLEEANDELEKAKEDKGGVVVSGRNGIDFGILGGENLNSVEIAITITSTESAVSFKRVRMRSSNRGDEHGVKFSARLRGKGRVVQKNATRQVSIIFHASFAGYFQDTLELIFFDLDKRTTFPIIRTVEATVGSREDHEQLKAKEPYTRRKIIKFNPTGPIIRSLRPPTWTKTAWKEKLKAFTAPPALIEAAYGPRSQGWSLGAVKKFMPSVFNENTYGAWFQVLLYLEEERVKQDLDAYSLIEADLESTYPRYKLKVEGLAENRPSVLVGDFILVSRSEDAETMNTRTWYEGRVHQVHQNHVTLRFSDEFNTYKGTKFDVRFVLNRLPYRRMHQALTNKFTPTRLLFPGPNHIQGLTRVLPSQIEQINPVYRPLGEDEEQKETVTAILNMKLGSVPFVVFGPPGTGKTVTIVEAMRQLLESDPNVRILACTPNNSAADLIAMKLMGLGRSQLFRLNSLSRKLSEMPRSLDPFCVINENEVFAMPDAEQLAKFRVVVSTCISAGVPASLGLKRGHFTHIFIDEAGQGGEPELMVPIKSIAGDKTNVILAGDNQQLGPVVNSNIAGLLGLKTSYLARIMQREIYDLNKYRGITIVKLVKNFRSHPDILHFSNEQFYNSELKTCGDKALTHSLENYEELPKKRFPLLFHAIIGKDDREKSSPSFFNIDEATQVKKYCISLTGNRKNQIKAEHIGVITPYHAQRCKILDLFVKDPKLRDIKVGSVEEFQGQERRVIIMSTVRSNTDYVTSDIKRSLGFVASKNRLNVALTRAQALLIVIGNPIILSLDPLWRGFLNYVHLRGGWRGKQIDWDPEEPIVSVVDYGAERKTKAEADLEDTIARLRAMILEKHEENGLDIGQDEEDEDAAAFERPILREAE
ncbi:RNA helicase [Gymnopilus junonius]|uniref:RNA helicase n=1 Tax=Gymnopilus junonius TaxID=109634 RepID=A0A9P5NU24_GYMJU|nr:RNA helicase [Gymnopilus junonius]